MIAAIVFFLAALTALPGLALLVLIGGARRAKACVPIVETSLPSVAVLVPAHNESKHLIPTLENLRSQLNPGDRLLVVADNCSDDTAQCALIAGAEVIERRDPERRGKGYALAYGVDFLRAKPPEVLVIVDADCHLSDGGLVHMSSLARQTGRPVQILNLMHRPEGAGIRFRMLEFAMRLKNLVRPLGMMVVGDACHLTGTGMAIPWSLAASAAFATGHVAEDMKLGVEMARRGTPPLFTAGARIGSRFVADDGVVRTQKTRWEHGHLQTISEELPGLLLSAIKYRNRALMAMTFDLLVPPMALYSALAATLGTLLATAGWAAGGAMTALIALMIATGPLLMAMLLAWWWFGRDLLSFRQLLTAPAYIAWKLPIYAAYALRRRSAWIRTRR